LSKAQRIFGAYVVALAAVCLPAGAQDRQLQIAPAKPAPAGERRVALVIGNSAYKTAPLRNPVNDARAISKALSATGFKVTVLEDASQAAMRRAIRVFGDELTAGGVGLFYYAGHGMQVRGKNFLIPVNADIEREDEIEDQAVDANVVLAKMDTAKNTLNLMILDACRNNPFARSFRSASAGLAQMDAPSGTLVAFATAPGSVASDGEGDNGLYTKHLLANIGRAGLPIEQVFKEVRRGVGRDTSDRQIPWESSSLRGDFYFIAPDPSLSAAAQKEQLESAVAEAVRREQDKLAAQQAQMQKMIQEMLAKQRAEFDAEMRRRAEATGAKPPAPAPAPASAPAPAPAVDREVVFWDSIKNSSNPEDYRAYLGQYPQGAFAALARVRANPPAAAPVAAPVPAAATVEQQLAENERVEAPVPPAAPEQLAGPGAAPPVQVASMAPTVVAAAVENPRYPKIGDLWEYAFKNITTGQERKAKVSVAAVSPEGILDYDELTGSGYAMSRAHAPQAELYIAYPVWHFSPYLLAFNERTEDLRWRDLVARNDLFCSRALDCTYTARVRGRESVKTPAGTFDTVKVVVELMGPLQLNRRLIRVATFWYSEKVKRFVKSTMRTVEGNHHAPDYDIELLSYKASN
jgi:hypothetical protein